MTPTHPIGAMPVTTPIGTSLDPHLMVNRRDFATLLRWSIDETLNQYHRGETTARITLIRAPEEHRAPWRIGGCP